MRSNGSHGVGPSQLRACFHRLFCVADGSIRRLQSHRHSYPLAHLQGLLHRSDSLPACAHGVSLRVQRKFLGRRLSLIGSARKPGQMNVGNRMN